MSDQEMGEPFCSVMVRAMSSLRAWIVAATPARRSARSAGLVRGPVPTADGWRAGAPAGGDRPRAGGLRFWCAGNRGGGTGPRPEPPVPPGPHAGLVVRLRHGLRGGLFQVLGTYLAARHHQDGRHSLDALAIALL